MNYKEHIERLDEFNVRVTDFITQNSQELKYEFNKLREYATALFERFAPFKEGDRVVLTKTPKIDKETSWGWMGSKHFLVKGAMATVHDVDYRNGLFFASLYFDDESWVDSDGTVNPVNRPALYTFSENFLYKGSYK